MRNKLPIFLVKVFYYEYWPFWLFFLPLVPYWVYLSIRSRSLTYFTAVNPSMPHSGVFGESKSEILDLINDNFLPNAMYLEGSENFEEVLIKIQSVGLTFPIIAKPDVGERGSAVEKIEHFDQLKAYLAQTKGKVILQEFIDFPIELGVLYFRKPISGESGISSIVMKEFLTVEGDGHSSIRELLNQNERFRIQLPRLEIKFGEALDTILEVGACVNLQPIGNHCLGTKFLSGQHLIDERLLKVFDLIAEGISGFCFGRFDLKVSGLEELYSGKGIKILELNGVTSEPGHIYDPEFNLFRAYKDTAANMKIVSDISLENQKMGVRPTSFKTLIDLIWNHFSNKESEIQENAEVA